jgi:MoaA/NifB/PqqE/SkfB family radical SAM enzyme
MNRLLAFLKKWKTFQNGVAHATFDPEGPGSVRLHLIPPKPSFFHNPDSLLVINGYYFINVGHSWATVLRIFIEELNRSCPIDREISADEIKKIEQETVRRVKLFYPRTSSDRIANDISELVTLSVAIGLGQKLPDELMNAKDMSNYTKHATGPQRMDLVVSPMCMSGKRCCQLNCGVCYAQNQKMMDIEKPLSTGEWEQIIDKCREARIPMITFTGGEPLVRKDIVKLVNHARWFVTRINSNGYDLSEELAQKLREASLDGIQITLYSHDPNIHDKLVGKEGAWGRSVNGIKNAIAAGLETAVNTPLLEANKDYDKTLRFLHDLGVHCVSCSGLIPSGGAETEIAVGHALTQDGLKTVLESAMVVREELGMDISFTSPGWLTESEIKELGLPSTPVCGACSSNMGIAPNGEVIPCQSWLNGESLGNMLRDPWKKIWKHSRCREIRTKYAAPECALKEVKL